MEAEQAWSDLRDCDQDCSVGNTGMVKLELQFRNNQWVVPQSNTVFVLIMDLSAPSGEKWLLHSCFRDKFFRKYQS